MTSLIALLRPAGTLGTAMPNVASRAACTKRESAQSVISDDLRIAVLLPCFDEEGAIADVVHDFRRVLPTAIIYVYDNNSADQTSSQARAAGAVVRNERHQGKGNVVRRMFADIEADIYILVDGDGTYEADSAPALIEKLLSAHLDMVVGCRVAQEHAAYRRGHRLGNWMLTRFIQLLFGSSLTDILSGYRVLSRRFVKSFPALAFGFEIETELTVHALELRMPVDEMNTRYKARPKGSESKLHTYADGLRILQMILTLFREERPLAFYGILFGILAFLSTFLAFPIVVTYVETGTVPRFPTAILATGTMILAFLSLVSGFILDTVTRGRQEMKRLAYLMIKPPDCRGD